MVTKGTKKISLTFMINNKSVILKITYFFNLILFKTNPKNFTFTSKY